MPPRTKASAAVLHEQGVTDRLARLRSKKPVERRYFLPLSDDAAEELNAAEQDLGVAKALGEDTALAERRVKKAQDAVRADSVEFVFRAAGELYDQLLLERPPTEQEKEQAKSQGGDPPPYGLDFLYGLAAVSLVEPVMTEDELREIVPTWSHGERQHFFTEVQLVNLSRRAVDLDALGK